MHLPASLLTGLHQRLQHPLPQSSVVGVPSGAFRQNATHKSGKGVGALVTGTTHAILAVPGGLALVDAVGARINLQADSLANDGAPVQLVVA